ncbi:unnamed protein product [[Candida] boidinii]|nr:unnamed protein product [[Candida] boidinii]
MKTKTTKKMTMTTLIGTNLKESDDGEACLLLFLKLLKLSKIEGCRDGDILPLLLVDEGDGNEEEDLDLADVLGASSLCIFGGDKRGVEAERSGEISDFAAVFEVEGF